MPRDINVKGNKRLMRYFVFVLTLILHFITILTMKLLDNFFPIIAILLGSIVLGFILISTDDKGSQRWKIGWGLFYGSTTSLTLTIVLTIYLSYALSG